MKKALIVICMIILITSISACTNITDQTKTVSKSEFLLGTLCTITVYEQSFEAAIEKAFDRIEEIENSMSLNIDTSDISNVNKNAGIKPVKVKEDVYHVLERAKEYAILSDGAFEPTIGPLVKLWGIGSKDNPDNNVPTDTEIKNELEKVNFKNLELLDNNKVYLKKTGMVLDLGAIAKGYAADEVRRILIEAGVSRAIIDLGGNINVIGTKDDGSNWRIGIQNPFLKRGNHIGILSASDKSIVTSGNYERYMEKDGKIYHHILDSETGYPSENEVAGIAVISVKSLDADALSTSLFVMGVEKGLSFVEKLDEVSVIYITKDKKIYMSPELENDFEINNNEFEIVKP